MDITSGKREGIMSDHALVMFTFPYDGMRRTYDRLRKASYRRNRRIEKAWENATFNPNTLDWDLGLPEGHVDWTLEEHAAYVAGVRDALNNLRGYRNA